MLTGALGSTYFLVIDTIVKEHHNPLKISKTELKTLIELLFKKELEKKKKENENENEKK